MKFKIISIFLFLMMLPQGMSIGSYNGHILYVGGSGEGNYTSIQDAINDANDGDTIFVYSGTYHEKINTYSKKICLIGENEKTTIIDGDGDDCNILEAASYNLEIHNFTITNGGTPGAGIHIYKKHYVTITHCTFSNLCHGILMDCAGDCTISKCIFENNELGIAVSCGCCRANNRVFHNNFINNTNQAFADIESIWDDGSLGNYWSDYNGKDENNDGIGDTPYPIPGGNNFDRYPSMHLIDTSFPSVEITYPKGGEKIQNNVTIKWNAYDDMDDLSIKIFYGKGGEWHVIAENEKNDGEYLWNIGEKIYGEGFSIKVSASDANGNTASCISGKFTILPYLSIKILKPENYVYILGREIMPSSMPIVFGDITMEANVKSALEIQKVIFSLSNKNKNYTTTIDHPSSNVSWFFNKFAMGDCILSIKAFDSSHFIVKDKKIQIFNL